MMYVVCWNFSKNQLMVKKITKTFTINQFRDRSLARLLGFNVKQLQSILKNNYNGLLRKKNISNEIVFKKEEDAQEAIEWMESIFFLNEMRKNNEI